MLEPAIDEALRAAMPGQVRRVEVALEELALAAGCGASARDRGCVAAVAYAGGADELVLQRLTREDVGWLVRLEVRGSDGSVRREVRVHCEEPFACGAFLDMALARAPVADSAEPSIELAADARPASPSLARSARRVAAPLPSLVDRGSPRRAPARATVSSSSPAARMPVELRLPALPIFLLVGSTISNVGALLSGSLILIGQADSARQGGRVTQLERDQARVADGQRDRLLALGTVLALQGVGLAVAAIVLLLEGREPSAVAFRSDGLALAF